MQGTPVRINAGDVQVGDKVSRRKAGPFLEVTGISPGGTASYLTLRGNERIRPRRTTPLWRLARASEAAMQAAESEGR